MQQPLRRVVLSILFGAALASGPSYCQTQGLDQLVEGARVAQSSGDYAGAAGFYRRATVLAPTVAELWANRGIMEFLSDQFTLSVISLKHALQLNQNLFTPSLFLGKAYVQLGKPTQALPYLNHAYAEKPNDPEVLLSLGKANADLNRQREAATFYNDATRATPESAEAWLGLGAATLEVIAEDGRNLAASAPQSPWTRALFADELFAQGRPIEASETYNAFWTNASPSQKATLARNLEWMQTHTDLFPLPPNSQEAIQALTTKLDEGQGLTGLSPCAATEPHHEPRPGSNSSLITDAACAFWAGDYSASAAKASQVLRQNPQDAEADYWSVKANERLAVSALSRFEDLAPKSATNFVLVGDLYRDQRQPDSALAEYQKALAIDSEDPAALMGAAASYLASNQIDDAESMDKKALATRPLDPQLNLLMAEILAAKNRYEQAKPYLEKCSQAPAELQSRIHYLLGREESESGNTAEAIRQFEKALPGDKDGSTHYQLMRLYKMTGDLAKAQKMEAEVKALIRNRDNHAAIAVREATFTHP